MGRSEPDVPSIRTPLAHETEVDDQLAREQANHQPALDQHRELDQPGVSVETSHRDGKHPELSGKSVSPRVTALLGPRPDAADPNLATWEHAATAIEQYRTDYNITADEPLLLGPAPTAGEFQQRYDRRQTAAAVLDALDKLDRPASYADRSMTASKVWISRARSQDTKQLSTGNHEAATRSEAAARCLHQPIRSTLGNIVSARAEPSPSKDARSQPRYPRA